MWESFVTLNTYFRTKNFADIFPPKVQVENFLAYSTVHCFNPSTGSAFQEENLNV